MDVRDFDFHLPFELIAQEPIAERTAARLLYLDRRTQDVTHSTVARLPEFLRSGDLLVVNNTRVFPARLMGHRVPSGGAVECLLIRRLGPEAGTESESEVGTELVSESGPEVVSVGTESGPEVVSEVGTESGPDSVPEVRRNAELWEALMHPGQKLKPGARVIFPGLRTLHGEVLKRQFFGRRILRVWTDDGSSVAEAIDAIGHVPLPPYIKREDRALDRDRYQTMFARTRGSVAAPTAGLHFTPALLVALAKRGVEVAELTLHVGYGTFQPVRVERVEDHHIDAEHYEISDAAASAINRALDSGRRVIAVGTTTTRTLEAVGAANGGRVVPGAGATNLFIYPGFVFRIIAGLVTNFHLPQSSLLMLVSAFAGREHVLAAYDAAIAARYRFYSYGDAMLIL